MQSRTVPSGLRRVLELCEDLPRSTMDRDLTPDVDQAIALLPALAEVLAESS